MGGEGAVLVPAVAAGRRVDADAGNADAGDGESLHGEKWDANIAIAKIAGCMHASPTRPSRRRFTRDLIFFFSWVCKRCSGRESGVPIGAAIRCSMGIAAA